MISSGAQISRYLLQAIIGHYTKSNLLKHIKSATWVRSLTFSSFAHFVSVGAARYGDEIELGKGIWDVGIVERYVELKTRGHGFGGGGEADGDVLDERWAEVRELFEKFEFCPFDDKVRRTLFHSIHFSTI